MERRARADADVEVESFPKQHAGIGALPTPPSY